MKMRSGVLLATLVLAMGLTGCQHMPWQRTAGPAPTDPTLLPDTAEPLDLPPVPVEGLMLSSDQRFPDIPLPVGLVQDAERTYVFESSTLQLGRMVYTSKASTNELAQFYLRELPLANWRRLSLMEADGVEMVYEKPNKRLTVTIRDLGAMRGRMLILNLVPTNLSGDR